LAELEDLSTTDASNTGRFPENQAPSTVNDGARALEGMLARWYEDIGGVNVSSGTDTVTLAASRTISAYAQGQVFLFEAGGTNTGAVTLNVDSVGAKAVVKHHDVALAAGDIEAAQMVMVAYEATADNFQMLSPLGNAPGTGSLDNIVEDTTPQLGGALDGQDNTVSAVNLKDYGTVTNAIGATGGGTQDIDVSLGNSVTATVDTSANTFTFSNPKASDELSWFYLKLTNGGSQTVNWPASVDWDGTAGAPTLTTSGVDDLVFFTVDGGTIWTGAIVAQATA
jgi:hypothetical protein|tara:strand:- start:4406 stop:5251 length:846 start_codon:yes stop_codon:yes gene_type:complete